MNKKRKTNKQLIHQYSQKLWNHGNKTFCDSFNDVLNDDDEFRERISEFKQILTEFAERIEKNTKDEIF